MENSAKQISKEVQNLLNKKGFISQIDLKGINLALLDDETLEGLLNKLNPKEKESNKKKAKKEKEFFSMYKLEDEYIKANPNLSQIEKSEYFESKKGFRSTKRKQLMNYAFSPISKELKQNFEKFLKDTYTEKDFNKIISKLGQDKQLILLDFYRKINKIN